MTIDRAFSESPDLKDLYDNNPDAKQVLDLAKKVEGSARHISIHAAAVVVAPTEITDFTPVQRETKGDKFITQYEMHACEDVGLIKFDILGLANLSILGHAVRIIEQSTGEQVDLKNLPLEDTKTFEMLSRGETMGVFQLAGSGMTKWLMELKPERVEDLMAMLALYRPGPMAIIPEYIARKKGDSPVIYYHPKMEKFLEPSYGLLVYQDDLLFTAIELAGYNWEEVDKFRKAVGKKIPEEMTKQHVKFVEGCQTHSNTTATEAEQIWDLFEPFQGYGFNKAHAAAYGMVSYQTAYLKANYPVEYMTAVMTSDSGDTDKIAAGVASCRDMGIEVLAPDINQSMHDFTVEPHATSLSGKAIRFGFGAIKNVGGAAIEAIIQARQDKPFINLTDFLQQVDSRKVNKKVLDSLTKVGVFDKFGPRAAILEGIEGIKAKVDTLKKKRASGQTDLFGELDEDPAQLADTDRTDSLPPVRDFTPEQKLAFEKELLGFYLSDNPLNNKLAGLKPSVSHKIGELDLNRHLGEVVQVGVMISHCRTVITKKNNRSMAFATVTDQSGSLDAVIFPSLYEETKDYWRADQVLLIHTKVEERDGNLSLIVEKAIPVASLQSAEADHLTNNHSIVIPRGTDQNKLISLNQILKNNPGEDGLTLIFQNGQNGGKHVPVPYGINYSGQLQQEITQLLRSG
jgi:DNA polymerase-3 subunit alpha